MVHKPSWFKSGQVFISYAPTVGINKDGEDLYVIDASNGSRTSQIDDKLAEDVAALRANGATTETSRWVNMSDLTERLMAVPTYFDKRPLNDLDELMKSGQMVGFTVQTVGALLADQRLYGRHGHGSPSADLRTGHIPYIKVSDIRAGQVNINPTNRVSEVVARKFWRGDNSGLAAYDLITPIRTSKNIGEFAVLMPGQESVVLTKEMLVLRAGNNAKFDNFYLLWAMTLRAVRRQWDRIVFMQTNREDVGSRYREIEIPIPESRELADKVSAPFRNYYLQTQKLRQDLLEYLTQDEKHYIFMSTSAVLDAELSDAAIEDELS